jgi:arylsulfatase A-like enzyme
MKKLILLILISSSIQAQDRPNILWLTYEDTSPEFIGCYGNETAKTPFIDFMAAEGVRFTSAYSTNSVCSPSRSALITGVKTYKLGTGNHRSNYPIPNYIKGFPKYLKDAGYYTSNNDKTDYNVANMKAFIQEAWNESSTNAGWWNKKKGQPFFAVFNSNSCHQSRTMTWPYEQYKIEVWDQLPENRRTYDGDFEMPPFYRDSPEMRKQLARVYNGLAKTDIEFQSIYNQLLRDSLLENTIIFSFADHGEGMPRMKTNGIGIGHRIPFTVWFPDKYKHLSPWGTGGIVTDEMIDFVDLAPTVLSLAGVDIPEHMNGRNILNKNTEHKYLYLSSDRSDESYDLTRTVIKGKYAYTKVFMPYIQELRYLLYMDIGNITQYIRQDSKKGLLNPQQQSLLTTRPAEFLFDLEKDPWELNNLADQSSNRGLLNELRKALEKNIIQDKDILFLPEYEIKQISLKQNVYEYRNANYPIKDIYAIAKMAGNNDNKSLKVQLRSLKSTNKFCRYWALMGLRSRETNQLKGNLEVLTNCLNDTYPPNQILAATILYSLNKDKQAKEILEKMIECNEDHLGNMAIQQLLYMNDVVSFGPIIKSIEAKQAALLPQEQLFNTNRSIKMFNYVHLGSPLPAKD